MYEIITAPLESDCIMIGLQRIHIKSRQPFSDLLKGHLQK